MPELISLQEKIIVGIATRTNNKDEQSPITGKLMKLWGSFFENDVMNNVPNSKENSPMYSVYSGYESDMNGDYDVTIGVEVEASTANTDFAEIKIEAGHYLLFKNKGAMPDTVIETWQQIWAHFPNSDTTRKCSTDFEVFTAQDEVEIYIGIT